MSGREFAYAFEFKFLPALQIRAPAQLVAQSPHPDLCTTYLTKRDQPFWRAGYTLRRRLAEANRGTVPPRPRVQLLCRDRPRLWARQ